MGNGKAGGNSKTGFQDPHAFIDNLGTGCLLGMAKTEKSLKLILDIDQVLGGMDLTRITRDAG